MKLKKICNMKRLFIFLFSVLVLTSCLNEGTERVTNYNGGVAGSIVAREFEYKGHQYIEFKDEGIYGQGFVHNPECQACTPMYKLKEIKKSIKSSIKDNIDSLLTE